MVVKRKVSSLRKKRILLLSEGFGKGHTQAAHALSVDLRQHSSEIITRVIELGAFLHPTLAPWVFSAYRRTVTSQPKLYGMLYRNQYKKSLNRMAGLVLHRIFYAQTKAVIKQLKPDIIVCTHPFPSIIVSRLKRAGLSVPLFTVITDYDVHGTWIDPAVDKYLVSTPAVRERLLKHGVPETHVEVTGIPVHPNFRRQHNKEQIRNEFGLKPMPTVMVMGGGWGVFKKEELLTYIATWSEKVQLLICLGTNEKARHQLLEEEVFRHPNVHLIGFTREINKLMDVSDLLITKPGGMTCTEAMAKGIPMLFYSAIPGQEEKNCEYFQEQGYGQMITSMEMIDHWFKLLLEQYPELLKRRSDIRSNQKFCAQDCSSAIIQYLKLSDKRPYIQSSTKTPIIQWY
ncbi:UDP-N-acetylglucosamine--LPS N-acetylglucosamine transferase [Paenibacillus sp. SYP-B3998]|uniref:UDP-N-acetylglucosamine--LPS N-acetylglucosamine transferase n=1 Tax=Paenibacillus sp. SYP-B3998 TaxID=2678564 RepID=A0A6G3ZY25_9BACL|nr:glycosyltransferase [Paenibacillus sp. SYP-B3998]NEW07015.1 UDP-N-acetylglucosamine--LPS N-acetylglucosamine transferase [Paenibacillus sp. SYP-B3998]